MSNNIVQNLHVQGHLTINQTTPPEPPTPHPRRDGALIAVGVVAALVLLWAAPPDARAAISAVFAELVRGWLVG